MKLSNDQQNALDQVMDFLQNPDINEMAVEGFSGTGKSTLTKHIIEQSEALGETLKLITGDKGEEISIYLAATTNKAAGVLAEKTGRSASTIHSLLGLRLMMDFQNGGTYLKQTGSPDINKNSLVIIDEASMENEELLKYIRDSLPTCKVLHIGDPDQLAPVREDSCPLFDTIEHKVQLNEILRNHGPIADLGQAFREAIHTGIFPNIVTNGTNLIEVDGSDLGAKCREIFTKDCLPEAGRLIAWTNKKVKAYNSAIRDMYTHNTDFMLGELLVSNSPIKGNKKLPGITTDQIVKITEVGSNTRHLGIDGKQYTVDHTTPVFVPNNPEALTIAMKEAKRDKRWRVYYALQEEIADLRPLHASTVHKSQGGTFDTVFIDLDDIGKNQSWKEVARMLYVAITRASGKVYFFGSLPSKYTSTYGSHL